MIFKPTKLIAREMDEAGFKYDVSEGEDVSYVRAGFSVKNGPNTLVHFISRDDDNDVAIFIMGLIRDVDESRQEAVRQVLNEANYEYRYVKFILNDEGNVDVKYDLPEKTPDEGVGPMCCEIFFRLMNIIEDVYPDLMKALWAE